MRSALSNSLLAVVILAAAIACVSDPTPSRPNTTDQGSGSKFVVSGQVHRAGGGGNISVTALAQRSNCQSGTVVAQKTATTSSSGAYAIVVELPPPATSSPVCAAALASAGTDSVLVAGGLVTPKTGTVLDTVRIDLELP